MLKIQTTKYGAYISPVRIDTALNVEVQVGSYPGHDVLHFYAPTDAIIEVHGNQIIVKTKMAYTPSPWDNDASAAELEY